MTAGRVFGKMTCPIDKINALAKNNKNKNVVDVLYRCEVDIHMSFTFSCMAKCCQFMMI